MEFAVSIADANADSKFWKDLVKVYISRNSSLKDLVRISSNSSLKDLVKNTSAAILVLYPRLRPWWNPFIHSSEAVHKSLHVVRWIWTFHMQLMIGEWNNDGIMTFEVIASFSDQIMREANPSETWLHFKNNNNVWWYRCFDQWFASGETMRQDHHNRRGCGLGLPGAGNENDNAFLSIWCSWRSSKNVILMVKKKI